MSLHNYLNVHELLNSYADVAGIEEQAAEDLGDQDHYKGDIGQSTEHLFATDAHGVLIQEDRQHAGANEGQDNP